MFDSWPVYLCRQVGLLAVLVCVALVTRAGADDGEANEQFPSPNGKFCVVNVPFKEAEEGSPWILSHFEIHNASGAKLYSSGGEPETAGPFSFEAYDALWTADSALVAITVMWEKGRSNTLLFSVRGGKAVELSLPDYGENAVLPVKWINPPVLRLRMGTSTGGGFRKDTEFFSTVRFTEKPWKAHEIFRTKTRYYEYGPE